MGEKGELGSCELFVNAPVQQVSFSDPHVHLPRSLNSLPHKHTFFTGKLVLQGKREKDAV